MEAEPSKSELLEKIKSLTFDLETLKQEKKELSNQLQLSKISMAGEWSLDLKTREVYWSEGMYEILNLEQNIRPDMKLFHEKLPKECSDKLNGALRSVFLSKKSYSFEHQIIFDDTRLLNARTDLNLVLDEEAKPVKVEGATSDITSIKSSQQELERLSLIASKTSNAIVILDIDGKVDWINTGFTIMSGYRIEEVKGTTFNKYLYAGNANISDPVYLSKQLSEHHSISEEVRLKTKRKKELWVHINISPVLNYELNPVSYILIMSDITQQRMVEEELRQTEKMAALGKLSAGLAHELNNPAAASVRAADQLQQVMTDLQQVTVELGKRNIDSKYWDTIAEWLTSLIDKEEPALSPLEISDEEEVLSDWFEDKGIDNGWLMAPVFVQNGTKVSELDEIASWCPPEVVEPVFVLFCKSIEAAKITDVIGKSTQSISNLVNVVKSYSYMDQAAVQFVDVHQGIDDTLKILAHKITPEIEIDRQFQNDLPKIQIVGSELNQVWTNLLDNALGAIEGEGKIVIRTSGENDKLKVEIEDSGSGIPKKIQEKIFDPFFTTKEVGEGTGLGLDVVRRIIVNRIGGKIDFISKPGETIFTVLIPFNRVNENELTRND